MLEWLTGKKKTHLRFVLRVGGKVMWDISENEMRDLIKFDGSNVTSFSCRSQFANTMIELTVMEYPHV
jgi:hypothetical protein